MNIPFLLYLVLVQDHRPQSVRLGSRMKKMTKKAKKDYRGG